MSVERAEKEGATLATAPHSVETAAVQVYRDPSAAARAILVDPQASQRLAAGQLEHYGELRGRVRPLLSPRRRPRPGSASGAGAAGVSS